MVDGNGDDARNFCLRKPLAKKRLWQATSILRWQFTAVHIRSACERRLSTAPVAVERFNGTGMCE
jgi:hypothetical protein